MQQEKKNGLAPVLAQLAQSGHAWVQFGTLALIGLSGLGNWVATWKSADRNKDEIEISRRATWEATERVRQEVFKQVGEIHQWIKASQDEFHQGTADASQSKKILNQFKVELDAFEARQTATLEKQNQIMANQTQMLEHDTVLLQEVHGIAQKIERLRNLDQMRGAPQ